MQKFNTAGEICYSSSTSVAEACPAPPSGATRFVYDGRGNRTQQRPANGAPTIYSYDQANRLVSARVPGDTEVASGQYHALSPTRIVDTITASPCHATPCAALTASGAGSQMTVQIAGSQGLPSSGIESVALLVSSVTPSGPGSLNVYSSALSAPPATAVSLWYSGPATSNTVITKVGPDGKIKIQNGSSTTHIAVDVLGWYADTIPANGVVFEPLTPTRILNTANGTGACTPGCAKLAANVPITVQVRGRAPVPAAGVSAVAMMVHAVDAPAGQLGALKVYPGTTLPTAATMAYDSAWTSGLAIVPLHTDGTVTLWSNRAVNVMFDVVGYYTDPTSGGGYTAYTLDGTLLPADTATTTAKDIQVAGLGGVPNGVEAVAVVLHAYNLPATAGYLTAWDPDLATPPGTGTLSWSGASTVSTTTIIPVGTNGKIRVQASANVSVMIQTVGYFTAPTYRYSYTGDGLRATKTAPDGTITRFTWDRSGGLPLLLREDIDSVDNAKDKKVHYLYGPDGTVTADITTVGTTEILRWYHHDHLGSTRLLTNTAGGYAGAANYTAFGKLTTAEVTPMGWAGEYRDRETGLIYLRARYYDPTTGQFLTRDPLDALTRSAYGYAENNPINFTDPTGLSTRLPSLGDFWRGLVDGLGCGIGELTSAVGAVAARMAGLAYKHRVGLLQLAAAGATVASLALLPGAPAVLAAASPSLGMATLLNLGAIGLNLAAIGQASGEDKGDQYAQVALFGVLSLGMGQLYSSTPLIPNALGWMSATTMEALGMLIGSSGT
jgi:RHS repeat-associated protein